MEVLRAEAGDKVLVLTRWRDREACRRVGAQREELRSRSAPRLTLTAIA
jgi:heme-degrading monooxygenase HmoA